MNLSIERAVALAPPRHRALRVPWTAVAFVAIAALWLPMLFAGPANLTSDESLYLAEAHSIVRGDGFVYPSGEPVTHRAPLFPALLAQAISVGGDDAAYTLVKFVVIVNALLVMALAWRMGGAFAGLAAGFAASASAYLNGLATTLYLDPLQCMFLLLALLALLEAIRAPHARWFAIAGACTGLAFLTKESAVQWAPLGVAMWLAAPSLRSLAGARGGVVFTLAFGAAIAPWLIWVYAHTSELFMVGEPGAGATVALIGAALAFTCFAAVLACARALPAPARAIARASAAPAAGAVIALWGAFMLYGLTRYSTWPYPNDYLHAVPAYLRDVAPQAQPYFLLFAAWGWTAWRALRGNDAARILAVSALLFAPFALFIANRGLQLRDALPIVYLSYVALGLAVSELAIRLRTSIDVPAGEALLHGGLAVAALALAVHQSAAFRSDHANAASAEVGAENWDSPFVHEIADWMSAHLPEGSNVLASRLYFSSLHVHTDGRFQIRQIPTVRVDVDPDHEQLLVPRSNLFRWEDRDLRASAPSDTWLYLRQFPGKGYWIGLRQQELLEYIVANEIEYVVLTGEDIGFSTLQYADYFSGHPAFTLLHRIRESATEQLLVFAVDRDELFVKQHSTAISPGDAAALERESGSTLNRIAQMLGTTVRVTDGERGLSAREEWAAVAGLDLGAP